MATKPKAKTKNTTQEKTIPVDQQSDDDLLTPEEFAKNMPFSEGSLNNSRGTGVLLGVPAPRFFYFNRIVRYPRSERAVWLANFKLCRNTAEALAQKNLLRSA